MDGKGTITLDWSYIFDILSIYNVKLNLCDDDKWHLHEQNFINLAEEIKMQIGFIRYNDIIESPFYVELYDLNRTIFSLVNKVEECPELGKEINKLNYSRYLAKQKLQKHFFNSEVTEIKYGYK